MKKKHRRKEAEDIPKLEPPLEIPAAVLNALATLYIHIIGFVVKRTHNRYEAGSIAAETIATLCNKYRNGTLLVSVTFAKGRPEWLYELRAYGFSTARSLLIRQGQGERRRGENPKPDSKKFKRPTPGFATAMDPFVLTQIVSQVDDPRRRLMLLEFRKRVLALAANDARVKRFMLQAEDDLTYEEMSHETGRSADACKQEFHRTKRRLADMLGGFDPSAD